jgi:ubiquinone/menaquinone biosynthesis C-methylase UbiE
MNKNSELEYFSYLKSKSFLGYLYQKKYLFPKLLKLLDGRMLDIGCGLGDMLFYRSNSVGVDVNCFNVEYCISRGLFVKNMLPDILPFDDNHFDSVLMDNVLEHIENPKNILKEIKRVLKSNGVLLIGVPGLRGQSLDSDHKVYYDLKTLTKTAEINGFEINKVTYTPLFKSNLLSKYLDLYCIYCLWTIKPEKNT